MLFLLMQMTIAVEEAKQNGKSPGVSNPWTEYVRILPRLVPVPTMWSEEQRLFLVGTSLEVSSTLLYFSLTTNYNFQSAINAKVAALGREFELLREKTTNIPWCNKCWWDDELLTICDWILIDALWRSRSLELPNAGEAMVPCLDMANHSSVPNAYYEETSDNSVALLLRPDVKVEVGAEITISYGTSKTPAEMLFSYVRLNGLLILHSPILNSCLHIVMYLPHLLKPRKSTSVLM